jgi:predicted PurR-regulated permease PerM
MDKGPPWPPSDNPADEVRNTGAAHVLLNPQIMLLAGIFVLMSIYALYFLRDIILPIVLAVTLYLLLQPSMRLLAKLYIPKAAAALLTIALLMGGIFALAFTVSGPVSDWIAKAPETIPKIERRLSFLSKPLERVQRTSDRVEQIGESKRPVPGEVIVKVRGAGLRDMLFTSTRHAVTMILSVAVLLFFLLISGDLFLRRLVEILPSFSDKKQAVEISNEIRRHISGYLITISVMNAAVGIATGIAVYFYGLSDPLLWGSLAFVLNYIIIVGPLSCAGILFLASLVAFDNVLQAVALPAIYLGIHLIESQTITPMLLARRLTLNPVLIIISLLFWYWMWGVAGALLAVPMLATFKIVCDRVRPLMPIGHFLGTEAPMPNSTRASGLFTPSATPS